jgi:lipopolysaccharide export system permease protein
MPTIVDRYMARQFIQVFAICFLSLTGLYIVIDAFSHLDHFFDYSDSHGSVLKIVSQYYAYRSLAFFDWMSGILALVAAMFTVTWIQRHNEMTALLAAGIPRLRVLRPVIAGAILVSLFAVANRELIIPKTRDQLAQDYRNIGGQREAAMQSRFDSKTDILLGGDTIIAAEQKILRVNFVLPTGLDKYGRQLSAADAHYQPKNDKHPAGYLLSGVTTPKVILEQPSVMLSDAPVIMTPPDNPWLNRDQVFVVSGVSFELLAAGATWRNYASTRELIHELRSPSTDLGADVRVAIHYRFLQLPLDVTLLFLGLPLVVSRGNRNPFIAIGVCLAVVSAFMLVVLSCKSLGTSGWIQPTFAAWLPLMIFAPLAVALAGPLRE